VLLTLLAAHDVEVRVRACSAGSRGSVYVSSVQMVDSRLEGLREPDHLAARKSDRRAVLEEVEIPG